MPPTQLGVLLDTLPDAVLMVDARSRIVYVNHAVQALLGYKPEELLDAPLERLIPEALRPRHAAVVAQYQQHGEPARMGARPVLHALHRDGRERPVSISLCNWRLDDGQQLSVAVMHDVAALHTRLDRATELAETDALTGLGNRMRLSNWIAAALGDGRSFALLYLDLRHFKHLNDTLGHAAGDRALQIVAKRLQSHVRSGDLVVRLGGDEFVVALEALDDPGHLAERAHTIAHAVRQPLRVGDGAWQLGANIGGVLCPTHGTDEAALLAAADAAMYRAKRAGVDYELAATTRPAIG